MNCQEAESLLVRLLAPVMHPKRFFRKDMTWYRHKRRTTAAIFMQGGTRRFFVRLALFNRQDHPENHPELDSAIKVAGMSSVVPDYEAWLATRTFKEWTSEADANAFVRVIVEHALPCLERWESTAGTPS